MGGRVVKSGSKAKPARAKPARAKPARKPAAKPKSVAKPAGWQSTGVEWSNDSHMVRGMALSRARRFAEARDELLLAIEHERGGTAAELQLLHVLEELDDDDGVIELTGRMLDRGIGSPVIGTARARALTERGRFEEAAAAAERAVEQFPDNSDAWTALAAAQRSQHDFAAAAAASAEAARLAPDWGWGWFHLANDLKDLGKVDEAARAAAKSVELLPEDGDCWFNLACFRALTDDADGALEALATAIRLDATNANVAGEDPDFDSLRDDPRFRALLG